MPVRSLLFGASSGFSGTNVFIHSHIFCLQCALEYRLTTVRDAPHPGASPPCPACQTAFEEAVMVSLDPAEDHRSTCLVGLQPHFIMEYAKQALQFWNHHMAEELYEDSSMKRLVQGGEG
jgi:hypothetical protein